MISNQKRLPLLRCVLCTFLLSFALVHASPALSQLTHTKRAITEIAEGVYRTQENRHFGLLVETANGIVIFDTLNAGFATWLDAEIKTRFDKPVTHVIYSHNHADHTSGGEIFAKHNPLYISHHLARASHKRTKAKTRPADITFSDSYTIHSADRKIELRYHGQNDGHGSISLLVPDEGVISVIDWLVLGRLPFRELNRYDVEGTIRSLHEIMALDWQLASPGHADIGGKDEAMISLRYLEALRDATMQEVVACTAMDQAVANVRAKLEAVPEFKQLKQFEAWVELNIRGVHFQLARVEGLADGVLPDPAYVSQKQRLSVRLKNADRLQARD